MENALLVNMITPFCGGGEYSRLVATVVLVVDMGQKSSNIISELEGTLLDCEYYRFECQFWVYFFCIDWPISFM